MNKLNTLLDLDHFLKSIQLSQQTLLEAIQSTLTNSLIISQESVKMLCESIISITDSIAEISTLSVQSTFEALLGTFHVFSETSNLVNAEVYDILTTFSKGISISNDEISLSDDALQCASQVIELPFDAIKQDSNSSTNLMSWQDFLISVLIPIILALLTMWQTKYLHDMDNLNFERQHIEELEYQKRLIKLQEERLEIEQEIVIYLENISDSLEVLQENPLSSEVPALSPELAPTEFLSSEEPADSTNETPDTFEPHNKNETID